MTDDRELEPPAEISWVKFEDIGMSYRAGVLLSILLVLAAAVVCTAIILWATS